ncbi:hypothetical protein IFT84_19590 [Rhizobium sp. CFBP 8762]|uniref:hypothetical protein n=1 Tax=Rhizobium sp. CFBP 8762 TaxID=2775279 RepID=UPI0017840B15|nr:hypothetical protein [Rhizobium sp. CFBP 8762]MBD8556717.1 hypothetical protein [Rhizobium sp. CFBP 8762]
MDRDQISQVLSQIPNLRSAKGFVCHVLFGPAAKLRRLRTKIKHRDSGAVFDISGDRLTVKCVHTLELNDIHHCISQLESDAEAFGIEYDGFEIDLDRREPDMPLEPFELSFSANTYVRFRLRTGRFGYLHFLGGDRNSGYLFDCLELVDDGNAGICDLISAPRLYRQPIQANIDPTKVEAVGAGPSQTGPLCVTFRLATGFPLPDKIEAFVSKLGIEIPYRETDWPIILEKMAAHGISLRCGEPIDYTAELSKKGRLSWTMGDTIIEARTPEPMLFGTYATLDMLEDALLGTYDRISYTDIVF